MLMCIEILTRVLENWKRRVLRANRG